MLVLTRKSNQSIMIGDDIEVSVLAIMGEKVRIGIEAPRSIPVFRKEVYLEIRRDDASEESVKEVDAALEKLKSPEVLERLRQLHHPVAQPLVLNAVTDMFQARRARNSASPDPSIFARAPAYSTDVLSGNGNGSHRPRS